MAVGSGGATLRERGYRMMDAVEYQKWRNRMCEEYSRDAGCEGRCPLAGICTPEDGQGHEEEAVRAVECYRAQKEAAWDEYARQQHGRRIQASVKCGRSDCMLCPIGQYIECAAEAGRKMSRLPEEM